jgi:hypothetical protein
MKLKLIAIAASFALAGIAQAQTSDKDKIEGQYKIDKAKCDSMTGNAKDVCMQEAKGKEKVAKAELDAKSDPSASNQRKVEEAKADAKYDVAKERCDDMKGKEKDACQKDAKAAHEKDKAEIEKQQASSSGSTTAPKR